MSTLLVEESEELPLNELRNELNDEAQQSIQKPIDSDLTTEQVEPTEEVANTSFRVSLGAQIESDEPCSSSDSEDDGDYSLATKDIQSEWKDWLKQQQKENIKMMSIMLTDTFINRFGLTKCGVAKETALFLGVNEKTIRIWRKDFFKNRGTFSESKQGVHVRPYILDDEQLQHKAATWVWSNSSYKGQLLNFVTG